MSKSTSDRRSIDCEGPVKQPFSAETADANEIKLASWERDFDVRIDLTRQIEEEDM
jgi:hypothetical protein